MTRSDDFTDLLETYLEEYEGTTPLPDAVRDAVRAALPSTQQHRGPLGPVRRFLHMHSTFKVALASAAVLVAAVLSVGIIRAQNVGGPDPSTPPSPTAEALPRLADWVGQDVPPGDYLVDEPFPVPFRVTVPEGLQAFTVGTNLASLCSNECELPERSGLGFWIVTNVYTDPCDVGGLADPPIGSTVDDLAAALVDMPRHEATAPTDVTVGGFDGTYLELTADEDIGDCALRGLRAWTAGTESRQSPPGDHDRLWILDVGGTRLMIDVVTAPGASPEEVAELEAMVDSIRFDPNPAGQD